jgi:DNA-binding MarR family transcriptional regulator
MIHATKHRLGFAGYCRILSGIYSKPGTGAELAERFKVKPDGMNYALRSMHRMGLIHRSAWVRPKAHSVLVPIWSPGKGCDVAPMVEAKRHHKRPARSTVITLATLAELLSESPISMRELADELCIHRETAIRLVRIMREHGLARIAEWERSRGMPTPLYSFGRGFDRKRPEPTYTDAVHAKRQADRRAHLRMVRAIAGNASIFSLADQASEEVAA